MTDLSLYASIAADVAGEAEQFDEMGEEELATMSLALKAAALASGALLRQRCGDDYERARLHISRASALPPRVLQRRVTEAERIVTLGGMPSLPQHAAHIAFLMMNVAVVEACLERKQTGAGLQ